MNNLEVGRVAKLWRYPVKSMAGEGLEESDVSWFGLAGDRRWAFVRSGQERNGFPWLTIRQQPAMWRYQPRITDPLTPDSSTVEVTTPTGTRLDVTDPALAAELGARVIKQNRGVFDTFPLSLVTTQTIASLSSMLDRQLGAVRFRPNLLVEATSGSPFPEDSWVGRTLEIGSARVRIDKRDQRCVVVNIDPSTTARDPAVLRAIGKERDACLGVYGQTVSPGQIRVGDAVAIVD